MPKIHVNPNTLFRSLPHGFSQIVTSQGGKTVYLSGQTAWDAEKRIVGGGDLAAQARRALRNVQAAMEAARGRIEDVVSLRIYLVNYKPADAAAISTVLKEFFPSQSAPASTLGCHRWQSPIF